MLVGEIGEKGRKRNKKCDVLVVLDAKYASICDGFSGRLQFESVGYGFESRRGRYNSKRLVSYQGLVP